MSIWTITSIICFIYALALLPRDIRDENKLQIIAEFADYCSQLVPEDVAKDYSDQLVQK